MIKNIMSALVFILFVSIFGGGANAQAIKVIKGNPDELIATLSKRWEGYRDPPQPENDIRTHEQKAQAARLGPGLVRTDLAKNLPPIREWFQTYLDGKKVTGVYVKRQTWAPKTCEWNVHYAAIFEEGNTQMSILEEGIAVIKTYHPYSHCTK